MKSNAFTTLANRSRTFIPVCHQDARHQLLLAVGSKGIPDHDLLHRQLALEVQGILPVELDFSWQTC